MKKFCLFIILFFLSLNAGLANDTYYFDKNLSDKILINYEEKILTQTKKRKVRFYDMRIYNNDIVSYKIIFYCNADTIRDQYNYFLKENEQNGRFPYTFSPHFNAVFSLITPITFIMYWAAFADEKDRMDLFIVQPAKSIILLPYHFVDKITEGNRNRKLKRELKKHYDMDYKLKIEESDNIVLEPGMEVRIPIFDEQYFRFELMNVVTGESYRIYSNNCVRREYNPTP